MRFGAARLGVYMVDAETARIDKPRATNAHIGDHLGSRCDRAPFERVGNYPTLQTTAGVYVYVAQGAVAERLGQ